MCLNIAGIAEFLSSVIIYISWNCCHVVTWTFGCQESDLWTVVKFPLFSPGGSPMLLKSLILCVCEKPHKLNIPYQVGLSAIYIVSNLSWMGIGVCLPGKRTLSVIFGFRMKNLSFPLNSKHCSSYDSNCHVVELGRILT